MLSFQHTEYFIGFLVLVPLAAVFFFVLRWKAKAAAQLGDTALINQLTKNYSDKKYKLKFVLLLVCIVFIIIAGANLRKPIQGSKEDTAGIDILVALDVSKSMWAEDVKPSRLDAAKQLANNLIDQLGNNRIGLVLFAGRAFLQMPLTTDLSIAKLYITNASPDAVPVQGTVLGDALQVCNNSLDTKEKKFKAVVLISDGEDHDEHSNRILKQLSDDGVVVNTIGVGTADGAPIKEPGASDYKKDNNGQTVITRLNEKELQTIAQQTGGNYYHLDDAAKTSADVSQLLNSMQKKTIESKGVKQYTSMYAIFVLLALLILIGEVFIPETKRLKNI